MIDWGNMPSPWTIIAFVFSFGVQYGVYKHVIARLVKDVERLDKDVKELRTWGEQELDKAVETRNTHFIRREVFNECTTDIRRRLDEVNTIDINSRLARIEAMLDQIQISLEKK